VQASSAARRAPEPTTLTVDDLVLDLPSRRVSAAARRSISPARVRARSSILMRNVGRVVSKTMILSHVWEYN
jgi:two-component system OmpR family response regulator